MNYNLLISELFLTPYLFKFTHGHTKAFGEFITAINIMVDYLPTEQQRRIIKLRYGFIDNKNYKFSEMAIELKITRERVRQIYNKAFRLLRQQSRYNILERFIHFMEE